MCLALVFLLLLIIFRIMRHSYAALSARRKGLMKFRSLPSKLWRRALRPALPLGYLLLFIYFPVLLWEIKNSPANGYNVYILTLGVMGAMLSVADIVARIFSEPPITESQFAASLDAALSEQTKTLMADNDRVIARVDETNRLLVELIKITKERSTGQSATGTINDPQNVD